MTVVRRKMEVSIRLLGGALLVLGLLTGGTAASAQCRFTNVRSQSL